MTIAEDLPPRWFALPLAAGLTVLITPSVVGVVAAVGGVFTPAVVIPVTALLGVPSAVLTIRALPRWSSTRDAHLGAAAVLAFVVVLTGWHAANHAQHLVVDRDPGVYLTTARHLTDEGDLLLPGPVGPFADAADVQPNSSGFSPERGDGTLEPQFPHLTATLLAVGGWGAELGLFVVTPALAGLSLLCLYGWATILVGPRWGAVAPAVTGLTMPFLVFARDTYSEPITSVLIFGGLWLLHVAGRSGSRPLWFTAGLTVGATTMARVDGYLYLAPLLLGLALWARLAPAARRRATVLDVVWCGAGAAAASAIGLWDTVLLTGRYFEIELAPRLPAMLGAAAAAGAGAWLVGPRLWRPAVAGAEPGVPDERPAPALRLLQLAALGCVAFFGWAWWLRPDTDGLPPVATEGVNTLALLPQAATLSLRWLGWYLGPLPLAVAVAGLLWAVVALGRMARPEPATVAGLAAVLVPLLYYLWSPNITPDHPWAMRRFAAVGLPGLAVGTAAAARALWQHGERLRRQRADHGPADRFAHRTTRWSPPPAWLGLAATVVVVGSLANAAAATWPAREARAQLGMRERMRELCAQLRPDDAVLVPIDGLLALMMPVAVGVWCDVPSAGGTARLRSDDVARLALAWHEEGRRLVVVSSSDAPLFGKLRASGFVPRWVDLAPVYPRAMEPTITGPTERLIADDRLVKRDGGAFTLHLYEVDVDLARRYLRRGH